MSPYFRRYFLIKKSFFIFQTKGKIAESETKTVKLEDAKKSKLIPFYKENKILLNKTGNKKGKSEAKQISQAF